MCVLGGGGGGGKVREGRDKQGLRDPNLALSFHNGKNVYLVGPRGALLTSKNHYGQQINHR